MRAEACESSVEARHARLRVRLLVSTTKPYRVEFHVIIRRLKLCVALNIYKGVVLTKLGCVFFLLALKLPRISVHHMQGILRLCHLSYDDRVLRVEDSAHFRLPLICV